MEKNEKFALGQGRRYPIGNVYSDNYVWDWSNAQLHNGAIVLEPVLLHNLVDTRMQIVTDADKRNSRTAVIFYVVAAAADSGVKPGQYCIVGEANLDFANPQGKHLICQREDLRVVWDEEHLKSKENL